MIEFFIALPIGTIIGWIIRQIVEDRLARGRNIEAIRLTEFNKASAIFRTAFLDTIYSLRKNAERGDVFISEIINAAVFISHEKAKILFEPYVVPESIEGFSIAWEQYKNTEDQYTGSLDKIYTPANINMRKDLSSHYLSNIENLLKYAKPNLKPVI